jgi:hypothetical protein
MKLGLQIQELGYDFSSDERYCQYFYKIEMHPMKYNLIWARLLIPCSETPQNDNFTLIADSLLV